MKEKHLGYSIRLLNIFLKTNLKVFLEDLKCTVSPFSYEDFFSFLFLLINFYLFMFVFVKRKNDLLSN